MQPVGILAAISVISPSPLVIDQLFAECGTMLVHVGADAGFGFGLGGGRRVETDGFRGATVIHGLGEDQVSKGDAPHLNELSASRQLDEKPGFTSTWPRILIDLNSWMSELLNSSSDGSRPRSGYQSVVHQRPRRFEIWRYLRRPSPALIEQNKIGGLAAPHPTRKYCLASGRRRSQAMSANTSISSIQMKSGCPNACKLRAKPKIPVIA
jgi:hypothetical protein